MSEPDVVYDVTGGVARITLNRPQAMNAMTKGLMGGLGDALGRVREDQAVRAVVLTGAGRGFCAGADLTEVADADSERAADDNDDTYVAAMRALMECPVPTVARINGAAAGGGFGLALACDITIAAHSAFFVATFGPRLGIVPDMGATWSIPLSVGRARALGITLLGDRISAEQAQAWGLIWQAVPDDALDDAVADAVGTLKRSSPSTVRRIRETVDAAVRSTFSDQLDLEMRHQAVLIPRNMHAGATAFLEKRDPEFGGERD